MANREKFWCFYLTDKALEHQHNLNNETREYLVDSQKQPYLEGTYRDIALTQGFRKLLMKKGFVEPEGNEQIDAEAF